MIAASVLSPTKPVVPAAPVIRGVVSGLVSTILVGAVGNALAKVNVLAIDS